MNTKIRYLLVSLVALTLHLNAQPISYFNSIFLQQQNAAADRAYLGISSSGGGITNFVAANFPPLFNSTITTPTTYPHLSFTAISQSANLVYASPNGAPGVPSFRALAPSDLPVIPGAGTVTNFSSGNLSQVFNATVATPTTFPQVTYALVTHSANTIFAGPTSGLFGFPAFRFLVTADLPDITSIVRGDVSATAPLLYSTSTGVFSMHVSDATHDGYSSSNDWSAFNNKITTVTNGGGVNSLIASSNSPVVALKSISAGAGVNITDNGGTNLSISSTASGGGGLDLGMTNDVPFSNGTNFYVDFNWQAHTFSASNNIAFNYGTNFPGSSATSRVSTVFIPATNYLRHIYFKTAATNWHTGPYTLYNIPALRGARVVFQAFGQGDTNVSMTPFIDEKNDPNQTNLVDLSSLVSIPSATNVLWVDATRGVFQDYLMTTPIQEGMNVLAWSDLGGQGNHLTNNTAAFNSIYFHNAPTAPFNVPCLTIMPPPSGSANVWLRSGAVTKVTQPVWVFFVAYASKTPGAGANVIDSISGTTTRMLCTVGFQGASCTIASANTSSFAVTNNLNPQWELFAFKFNSTTSQIRTNSVSIQTNNAGTGVGNGFTFGSDIVNTLPSTATSVAELAVFWGNLTAADLGNIETNYFMAKYGIGR